MQTALCLAVTTVFAVTAQEATELNHWPDATKRQLDETLPHNASEGNFAVSDTASTSYRTDLEKSLIACMKKRGRSLARHHACGTQAYFL